jgi:hypothetical protein
MSQFDGLLDIKTDKKTPPRTEPKIAKKVIVTPPPVATRAPEKQPAKSRRDDYIQTSVYIKKETHTMVKRALLIDSQNRDFSELVEDLILSWASKIEKH